MKKMLMKRTLFILLLLSPLVSGAQNLAGSWSGVLDVGATKLRLIFHLAEQDGAWSATMDSPDQGVYGFPGVTVTFAGQELAMAMPALNAVYKGRIAGKDSICGRFDQSGGSWPLDLIRAVIPAPKRPQEPQPPYPYREEEVTFRNEAAGATFHGTLTLPGGKGPFPAVVMVTGSGLQDRNEELFGHKPFLVIADYLARRGIAVLRYDDRGYGGSIEEWTAKPIPTTEDYMTDAMSAFGYLTSRKEINPIKTGIIGHSEGGTIAIMAGARHPEVAFMVSLAGMALRGDSLLQMQSRSNLSHQGIPAEWVGPCGDVLKKMHGIVLNTTLDQFNRNYRTICDTLFNGSGAILPEALRKNCISGLQSMAGHAWWRYFLSYDPSVDLAKLNGRPLLALNGTKDFQVDADANLAVISRYITPPSLVRRYEGLNHLFQHCTTGALPEYAQIEETFAPEVLKDMADWILEVTE